MNDDDDLDELDDELVEVVLVCGRCGWRATVALPGDEPVSKALAPLPCFGCGTTGQMRLATSSELPPSGSQTEPIIVAARAVPVEDRDRIERLARSAYEAFALSCDARAHRDWASLGPLEHDRWAKVVRVVFAEHARIP